MLSPLEHIDNLWYHIRLVQDNCLFLGKALLKQGHEEIGRTLIANGLQHDYSKFFGDEWKSLHAGKDAPKQDVNEAIKKHNTSNKHHPEFWGGIEKMEEIYVAEMVCDWSARSQERRTDLREWIEEEAVKKYQIKPEYKQWDQIKRFVDLLVEDHFVKQ